MLSALISVGANTIGFVIATVTKTHKITDLVVRCPASLRLHMRVVPVVMQRFAHFLTNAPRCPASLRLHMCVVTVVMQRFVHFLSNALRSLSVPLSGLTAPLKCFLMPLT